MKKREILSTGFFIFLILIMIMDNALILPNEVLVAADLKVNFDAIGILIGLYTIILGVSILVFGYLTDKINRKRILIFSGLLWAIPVIFYPFILEFWQLLLLRIIAAIATGVTAPLTISYLADMISPKSRSKSFAFWGLVETFATLFASFFALAFNLIDFEAIELPLIEKINFIAINYPNLLYTWRLPYFYLGILALIVIALNSFIVVEPKRAAKETYFEDILSEENLQYSYKIKFADLKFIFKRKSNFFLIFNFFDVIASGLLVAYIFPYIQLEIGVSVIDLKIIILFLVLIIFGLILGQFWLAHWGDRKVQKGDLSGRVKIAVICSILNLPFLLIAFTMSPNVTNHTFFFNSLVVNEIGFWVLWIIFTLLIGLGMAFTFGIAPNWYSAMIDVNFPENRGTMIAIASFIDTIGRAIGALIGGFVVVLTGSFSSTIIWTMLIFGIISIGFWIPLFFTAQKDFDNVNEIMKERAREMEKK
ncbi:MAG: MFS transporter [Promethearchaeota archaeon]|jgi:MFS family permease